MSRFRAESDDHDDDHVETSEGLAQCQRHVQGMLRSERGRQALTELRDALHALPQHRLIEGALCTVGGPERVEMPPETAIAQQASLYAAHCGLSARCAQEERTR